MPGFKSPFLAAAASFVLVAGNALPAALADTADSAEKHAAMTGSKQKVDNSPYKEAALQHYNRAVELYQEGSLDEALKEYEAALAEDSRLEEAWSNLGVIYNAKKNYTKAGLAFEKALSLRPDRPVSLNGYGNVLYQMGKNSQAKSKWEQAIRINPHFAPAHYNLGMLYDDQHDYVHAIAEYEKLVRLNPKDTVAKERLAAARKKSEVGPPAPIAAQSVASASEDEISSKDLANSVQVPGDPLVPNVPAPKPTRVKDKSLHQGHDKPAENKQGKKAASAESGQSASSSDGQSSGEQAHTVPPNPETGLPEPESGSQRVHVSALPQPLKKGQSLKTDSAGNATLATNVQPQAPFKVSAVWPLDNLSQAFKADAHWRGADGGSSIPLTATRSLWLFGDTFIRRQGAKVQSAMLNNTAAWLNRESFEFKFFWREADDDPISLVSPEDQSKWYWPDDGFMLDGHLFMLFKRIVPNKKEPPELAFDWIGDDFIEVDKPQVPPDQWQTRRVQLPDGPNLLMGAGCFVSNAYVYIFTTVPSQAREFCPHPIGLARASRREMSHLTDKSWEYLCEGSHGGRTWQKTPNNPAILFPDGATEITVTRLNGEPYLVATYMPPLSSDICLRFARNPEGPWSEPLKVFQCKQSEIKVLNQNVMVYTAKAHAELSMNKDELVITYCVNPGNLERQNKRPDLYYPNAISVTLEPLH